MGKLDRQKYAVTGIELPIADIEVAVRESLNGTPHLSHRSPIVDVVESCPEGATIQVTVEHDLGYRIDDRVIARLRNQFPEATVATTTSTAPS